MIWKALILLIALAGAAIAIWIRVAPADPARWHVDPVAVPDPAAPMFARIAPGVVTGTGLMARADAAMRALPRTRRIAGSVAEGWATYETRSRLMGYPDYTSIRVLPAEGGETLAAFARSRFGANDWGVNAARLAALRAALGA